MAILGVEQAVLCDSYIADSVYDQRIAMIVAQCTCNHLRHSNKSKRLHKQFEFEVACTKVCRLGIMTASSKYRYGNTESVYRRVR
jgi:hypothetical protein